MGGEERRLWIKGGMEGRRVWEGKGEDRERRRGRKEGWIVGRQGVR